MNSKNTLNSEVIKERLRGVIDRETGQDVVSAGFVSGVVVKENKVGFVITIKPEDKERKAWLREACEAAVRDLPGVEAVTAVLTAQTGEPIPPKPEAGYAQPRERANWNLTPIEGVKKVIAVASGKGGVGKSTFSVNLALALVRLGKQTGLLDADIYGPSVPRMLGLSGQPDIKDGKMQPMGNFGIKCMSMGFITGDEAAILRGPMISKALQQLLRFTHWAPLDTLLVDMPPGTGDIHLSMAQQVPLSGAVIVTTPQEVAVMDARKCLQMFRKVGVPILGVVENMSYFTDSSGGRVAIFGEGGGKKLASEENVPFFGDIPLDPAIREAADNGREYEGVWRSAYEEIAARLA